MIWPTRSVEPGRFDAHPAGELADRIGVLGRVLDCLGEQRDRADRGLELVADVGHEVAPGLLDPARAVWSSASTTIRSSSNGAIRTAKCTDDARAPREICRSTVRRAWSRRTPRTSWSSSGTAIRLPRTSPRVRALLVASSTSSCGPTTMPEEFRIASTSATPAGTTARRSRRSASARAGARRRDPHDQHAQDDAHDQRDGGGRDRVHRNDSRGRATAAPPSRRGQGRTHTAFGPVHTPFTGCMAPCRGRD